MYKVRLTALDDVPRVMELFGQARAIMRADGNMGQWVNGYPSKDVLLDDISGGNSYVMEDESGVVVASFAFIPGIEPTYLEIEGGEWLDDVRPYATIHRLASGPDSHGVARACFDYCWQRIPNLRVDTHEDNRIMQHCILASGFTYCGVIYLANGDPRLAYQKV